MRRTLPAFAFALSTFALPAPAAEPPFIAPTGPRTPAEEAKAFHLPPGFEAQLVASEPDIHKPINMAFDARGRLWVTDSVEYPFPAADGQGRDSVKVLEDFGPDGRARKVTTFADGLNIPIGILPYQDGAIVYSIPYLWRLRDTDGDGKCDQREILYKTFGHRDTHGMCSSLLMGFDGWVYACHGFSNDSTVEGKDGAKVHMNSGNTFRFKPDGSHAEAFTHGQVNPFGQTFDAYGNLYNADCHSKPITQLLRGAYYSSFGKPHDGLGFGPDMVQQYRGSTALCGVTYNAADHFPPPYRDTMFLGDVVYNCINYFRVERHGGTYKATQQPDFLTSDDPWFRPVTLQVGPDGALYVADFYNKIIGHYEVPLTHPGRDRERGRIWRIVWKGTDGKAPPPKAPHLGWNGPPTTIAELVEDLGHPTQTVRMLAMNQLVERGEFGKAEDSIVRAKAMAATKPGSPPLRRAHAMWVMERTLGGLDDKTLAEAVNDAELLVRVHALRILAERPWWMPGQRKLVESRLHDSDGLAQRVAAEALGRHPDGKSLDADPKSLDALLALRHQVPTSDPFLLYVTRMALRDQLRACGDWDKLQTDVKDVRAITDAALGVHDERSGNYLLTWLGRLAPTDGPRLPEFVHYAARYAKTGDDPALLNFIRETKPQDVRLQSSLVQAFLRGMQERGAKPSAPAATWVSEKATHWLTATDARELQAGIDLAAALKDPALQSTLAVVAVDRNRPEKQRVASLAALANGDLRPHVNTLALCVADATESIALRERAAQTLAAANLPEARAALVAALPTAPARLANVIAGGMLGSAQGAEELLQAVAAGKASPRILQERLVQIRLDQLKLPNLQERLAALTQGLPPADERLTKLLAERRAGFLKAKPDPAQGVKVYTQYCAICHQIGGQGAKVGPQLDGIGVRGVERLLEDVLDPNRNVDQAFRTTTIVLKTGQQLSGLVLREEGQVVVLADAQGKEQRIGKDQIESRETLPLSPMPANLHEQIAEPAFYDLLAYLLAQRAK